jgi:hypothetical protein
MIIRRERERLRIGLQPEHARLSGDFAQAWGGGLFHSVEPLAAVRLAADLHDEGWAYWERHPQIHPATGYPLSFTELDPPSHVDLYRRGINIALEAHPYAGLLVSLHGAGLHSKRYGFMDHLTFSAVEPEHEDVVQAYLGEQKELQQRLINELKPDQATLWTHYRWLQAWDLLSLMLYLADPADGESHLIGTLPHYPGGPESEHYLHGAGQGRFQLDPWPFEPDSLEVMLPVRYLPDRPYASNQDFQEAFQVSPTASVRLHLLPSA